MVRRLDRLADHVDGLCARTECSRCGDHRASRSRVHFNDMERFAVPVSPSDFLSHTRQISKSLNLSWRRSNILPETSCTTSDDCGVLKVWFVASMRFVGHHQLVRRAHEK